MEIWRAYADDVTGAEIPECGHFIPEERPEVLPAHLRDFLMGGTDRWHRPDGRTLLLQGLASRGHAAVAGRAREARAAAWPSDLPTGRYFRGRETAGHRVERAYLLGEGPDADDTAQGADAREAVGPAVGAASASDQWPP
ncbi:alpha/beta fold hydrolase [Streptomyces sp. TLI_185]|uniref:alpha/beta fold hydrolase n=1 Tax=Streptomyces sp. TLI_185 TaxID=2485151 RepID=UPI0021A87845|nr:hypothetical protein [Streptomyces sp. TLI_185]